MAFTEWQGENEKWNWKTEEREKRKINQPLLLTDRADNDDVATYEDDDDDDELSDIWTEFK